MRAPVIVVTGAIASGKTMVAHILAGRGGTVVDCDLLAHRALEEIELKEKLVRAFGSSVLTSSGRISRAGLGRIVFSDDSKLNLLNQMVRPFVKRIISDEVMKLKACSSYIVLDAVLFFQYKFKFKVDLVISTVASEETCLRRIMRRDGLSRKEALMRIERQRPLYNDWSGADLTVNTDGSRERIVRVVAGIRDCFLKVHNVSRRE